MNVKGMSWGRCGRILLPLCALIGGMGIQELPANAEQGSDTLASSRYTLHREVWEGRYTPVPTEGRQTSPAYRFSTPSFFSVQVNVNDSGRNIVGDAANEPSIAIDPTNPARMAIGWRQFNTVTNSFRQAGFGYTTNGGLTWRFPGVIDQGIFRSDPVLESDARGTFYYNSLTSVGSSFRCDVFKSSTGGATWGPGTPARGGDKQWMAIDQSGSAGEGHIYAFWTAYYSACPPGSFTRSTNRGLSYQDCITIPDDPYWGTLDVGHDGTLYLFGAGTSDFVLARSTSARDSSMVVSWDTAVSVYLGGLMVAFPGSSSPNPGGLLGQAWVAVDRWSAPYRGNVYALCSVRRTSPSDPLDVMFARSTDGGLTWSPPVRVNDDPGTTAWQWFGTMSVAPNGRIDAIWLDTRDNPGGVNSSLYYSFSTNAGTTWSVNQRLSNSFNPHLGWPQQNKLGDYFDMVSDNAGAHVAWAGTFNSEQDVYYGRITLSTGVGEPAQASAIAADFSLSQNYPNPFNPETEITYRVGRLSHVRLSVHDVLGREVVVLVDDEREPGRYSVQFNAAGLASGLYVYRLQAGSFVDSRKMLLLR